MSTSHPIRNIVLIIGDQHRQDCLSCYGNTVVRTPHIDALAAHGCRFTHAFTPSATCTPARASLFTGLTSRRHGLIFNPEFVTFRGGEKDRFLPEARVFTQGLAERGWNLAHVGKWHVIGTPADFGCAGAFHPGYGYPKEHPDYLSYLREHGLPAFTVSDEIRDPTGNTVYAGRQAGPSEASEIAYVTTRSIEFIDRFSSEGKPFCVTSAFWGPHQPFILPEPHYSMYDGAAISPWPNFAQGRAGKPGVIRHYGQRVFRTDWIGDKDLSNLIGKYYGYISLIDDQVGRIVEALRRNGQLDKTLIIYTSDHGCSMGAYRMWDKGFGMYDCFYRIPFLVAHPSINPGTSDAFVSLLDIAPTMLALGGGKVPDGLDGHSLLPIFNNEAANIRPEHMYFETFGHMVPFWQRMLRTRTNKYIFNPTDVDEFYDLANDPWELYNLLDDNHSTVPSVYATVLAEMRQSIHDRMWASNDPARIMTRELQR